MKQLAAKIFEQTLKDARLSNTKPRRLVFEALLDSHHEPLTMPELQSKICGQVDRSSIYRAVESLESIGIIHRLHIGWKYKLELSDTFHGHHHHITCMLCGRTQALEDNHIEETLVATASTHGFILTDHQLDMRGLCVECRQQERSTAM